MVPLTTFIGREQEFTEIQQLLAQPNCHLLTLVGPGGIGKTRLALNLGAFYNEALTYGAVIVELESLHLAEFFIPAIADALRFNLTSQETLVEQLGRYLADKEVLIILDNFEHIMDATDDLTALLPMTPHVTYLVTSREPLNLQEEWLYPLNGLTFPPEMDEQTTASDYDAIQLFNERASRVYPDFSLADELGEVVRICQLVDGLPLALELAAAWRRTFTCQAIAAEIQHDLEFLNTRLRNVPERHRSIQSVFDQTWVQLSQKEQEVFKRLSVFSGGFRRSAAMAAAQASPAILARLVEKCLLRVAANGSYHLHQLLGQYAAEHLAQNEADVQKTKSDHAAYYISFLHNYLPDMAGRRQREALTEIRNELDNIRAAWLWVIAQCDTEALRKGGETLAIYYQMSGNYREGMRLFSQAVEVLQAQPPSEAVDQALLSTLLGQSWFHLRHGRPDETEAGMKQMLTIYQRLGLPLRDNHICDPVAFLSIIALIRGDFPTAVRHAEASRQMAEAQNHPFNRQFAYHILSEAYLSRGQIETAYPYAQQAYTVTQTTGDKWLRAYIRNNLGQMASMLGDNAAAKIHFQESYQIRHDFDDPEGMALASNNLANIALKEEALAEAEARFQDSRKIYQKINDKGGLAATNRGLGIVALAQKHYETAQDYFRQALQLGVEVNFRAFLLSLLINIAELLWQMGQSERPITLLAYTAQHAATDHETKINAQQLLQNYQLAVSPQQFTQATQLDHIENLSGLCTTLLYELTLPFTARKAEETAVSPRQPLLDPLTPRELEVLQLIADGYTNPEIANELIVSVGTIKTYTNRIFSKLGVRNRVEAATRARKLNLL